MLLQFLFGAVSRSIDTGQHLVLLVASPVRTGRGNQLKCLDTLGTHQMRPRAQIHPVTLGIEGNLRILRKILDQLHFIRLIPFPKKCNGLLSGLGKTLNLGTFFGDLLHFLLYGIQILSGKRCALKIIIKPGIDRRPDGHLCIGEQGLHRLRQHMGCRMAQNCQPLCILCRKDIQLAVPVQYGAQIRHLPVDFPGACGARQTFTDVIRNINNSFCFCIFLR